jgi:hypothetical protein
MKRMTLVRSAAAASFALLALSGVLVAVYALTVDGISIGGDVCGGAGASQRCLHLDRVLLVGTDLGWFSVAVLATGATFAVLGIFGVAVSRLRLWLGLAAAVLVVVAMVGTEHLDSRFCPGEPRATCGRSDDAWGPVLRAPLVELRGEERLRFVGKPVEPGGPVAEAGQTFETFRASPLTGWTWIRRLVITAWFLALAQLAVFFIRPLWAVPVAVATLGGSGWAAIADSMHPCLDKGSDCYRGLLTLLAVGVSAIVWLIALAAARIAAFVRLRRR